MVRYTVLIPARNAELTLETAVKSILLDESSSFEIIIIDDNSTDRSAAIMRDLAFKYPNVIRAYTAKSSGIANVLNEAIQYSRGAFLMRCDADDVYPVGRADRLCSFLDLNPEFGAVCGGFEFFTSPDQIILSAGGTEDMDITSELRAGRVRTHIGTFVVRRAVMEKLGQFRPFFATSEDIDFELRLSEQTKIFYLKGIFYRVRIAQNSTIHSSTHEKLAYYDSCAYRFQRQRQSEGQDDLQKNIAVPAYQYQDKHMLVSARDKIVGYRISYAWQLWNSAHKNKGFRLAIGSIRYAGFRLPLLLSVAGTVVKMIVKFFLFPGDLGAA